MQFAVLFLPLFGTSLGAAMVFFLKQQVNQKTEKLLMGFGAGVMIAASVWSLLIPAIEMTKAQGGIAWIPAAAGFLIGIAALLAIDGLVPYLHKRSRRAAGTGRALTGTEMMLLAVTVHNIPEGMAVGVTLAGALNGHAGITLAGVLALSIGIAVQNFPEGAIVSMPLRGAGMGKCRAFLYGVLSGVVEPVGAAVTLLLTEQIVPLLPYMLSFAAGAMLYVVIVELIPETQTGRHKSTGTIGAAAGFVLMMVLDVALG